MDIEKDMGRLDNNLKISDRRKNKNVLNNERLKTAGTYENKYVMMRPIKPLTSPKYFYRDETG